MKTFLISLQVELMKVRRSAALWVVVLGTGFLPLLQILLYLGNPSKWEGRLGKDPWMSHMGMSFEGSSFFLWPMFIVLVATMVTQIEYKNNTWKQVMASPLKVGDVFFSKYIIIQGMILAAYLLFNTWMLFSASFSQVFHPAFHFFQSPVHVKTMLFMDAKSYIAILGMSTIQYCISIRLKNFIASVGIGLALVIVGLTLLNDPRVLYFPYSYAALTFMRGGLNATFAIGKHEYWSLAYFAAFLSLGFVDFLFRRERG